MVEPLKSKAMLKGITWTNYFTAAAILVVFWYLVIGFVYYRREIFNLLSGKTKVPLRKNKVENPEDDVENSGEEEHHSTLDELETIVNDIRHSILEEAGNEANKEQLLGQLQQKLASYDGLRQPAFRIALNNFIIQNAERICGVSFSEGELDAAWEAIPR